MSTIQIRIENKIKQPAKKVKNKKTTKAMAVKEAIRYLKSL